MKAIRYIARFMVRLFFIMLLAAGVALIQYKDKMQHLGYINLYQWQNIFPLLLMLSFVGLLITCTVKKFQYTDLNLLLIVNAVMLIIYGMAVFWRVSAAMG